MAGKINRREFLVGCSAAIAAMAGARLTRVAFGKPSIVNVPTGETLVVVFLRGGWDALNVVPPISGSDRGYYEAARAELQVPVSGEGSALPLDSRFGLHPAMAPLHDLYQDGKLAIVHACGLNSDTRSHFDAMQFIELGTPGVKTTSQGWMTRYLEITSQVPTNAYVPALAAGSFLPDALLGSRSAVAMNDPNYFEFSGDWYYRDLQRAALRELYNGDTWLYQTGTRTLDTVDLIEALDPGNYVPANGAVYPSNTFGDHLQTIAQMMKYGVGLHLANIDLGGWDTHEYQGSGSGGYFAGLLEDVAGGLAALYTDLSGSGSLDYASKLNVVVISEFGRRLRENFSYGTDHGHGSVMMVLGGHVNGGQVYGNWPGLRNDQLYDGADLAVTTDYRRILSEILISRMGITDLSYVFPGYAGYSPFGIVQPMPIQGDYKMHVPMSLKQSTSARP